MRLHASGLLLAARGTDILSRPHPGADWNRTALTTSGNVVACLKEYTGTETLVVCSGDMTVVRARARGTIDWWTRTIDDMGEVTAIAACGASGRARPIVVVGLASGAVAVVALEGASQDIAEFSLYDVFPGHAVTALAEASGCVCAGGAGTGQVALMMLHRDGYPTLDMVRRVEGGAGYPQFEGAPPVPRGISSIAMVPFYHTGTLGGFYVWHCGAWSPDGAQQPQCLIFGMDDKSGITWTCPQWRVSYEGVPCGGRKRVVALWSGAEYFVLFHNGHEPAFELWSPDGGAVPPGRARAPDARAEFRDETGRALHIHDIFQVAPDRVSCVVGDKSELMDWCVLPRHDNHEQ